jgi:ribosomal protein S5
MVAPSTHAHSHTHPLSLLPTPQVHTVPIKTTGECGSVLVRLIPAPRGAGIVAARTPKKVLQMAGIEDCYTCSRGSTKTLGNFVKATFYALAGERPAGSGAELAVVLR